MAEGQAFLIAAGRGAIQVLSGKPRAEQARPILEQLFQNGIPASRAQEIHWHGREDEYWLNQLGEAQGFSPDLARFYWTSAPLLAHGTLHLAARAVEAGDRELIILAQESGDQVAALLVGSRAVVEEYQASPRLRIASKLVFSSRSVRGSGAGSSGAGAAAALSKAGQEPGSVQRVAFARQFAGSGGENPFPNSKTLSRGADGPSGDFFLLVALAETLEAEQQSRGLLISEGPQKSGMATLFERG